MYASKTTTTAADFKINWESVWFDLSFFFLSCSFTISLSSHQKLSIQRLHTSTVSHIRVYTVYALTSESVSHIYIYIVRKCLVDFGVCIGWCFLVIKFIIVSVLCSCVVVVIFLIYFWNSYLRSLNAFRIVHFHFSSKNNKSIHQNAYKFELFFYFLFFLPCYYYGGLRVVYMVNPNWRIFSRSKNCESVHEWV